MMKERDVTRRAERRDRLIREHVHDPYKLRQKLPDPTRCPQCGAVYTQGRWAWSQVPVDGAHEEVCQACHRINDRYPAGEIVVRGAFAAAHRDEIASLARNVERYQSTEHPLHRIMDIQQRDGDMVITTTDVHLPRAIGHALEHAWKGTLDVHYDEDGYFVRIEWQRDE